ncbi:MFS transporter [Paraburkholderia caballeronis]|uniref:Drug resistance transporter, EmrB/QacA subfamily n=1 Tax=Paraburkholderia caballeronis TaxID=416943 RepID=A0A1H7JUS9_9BURK|nr:MFS transporter [Paraburkholderia caballeronis]PXW27262.1 EmrB/QacA subfamily drug resistance transporter [Paraburkholderia caballeronis]PXX02736.1 EmrB/QacA subfamily drug resistance transporter [Paraburkholderia caballeronis]RAK03461.1 EmrB/QacA subfamily drug resistance transporter [Paraburkholderia caballeronis]TDV17124.1 EmrB/QacA subfamily drug resistance transporter [Paraburkholderia caballeronis]TDV17509.1 EmrB/QacA subfamily drug resistance transporter [Paraburkholderia caballeroni
MTDDAVAATPPLADAPPADARSHHGWALVVLLVGAILPPLDYFIVNLALPAIRDGLGASAAQLQLVVSAYACANAVAQITGGRLGDLYGRKRLFMLGMAGFVLASTLCGLATSGSVLVAGRVLQGLFAAILAPQVLATIRSVFAPHEQVRVMSFYGFVFGVAAVIGQLGGGALISLHPFGLGWRAIFLVNLPIGVFALLGSWRFIPESRPPRGARIDLPGTLLLSLFLLMLVYPLTRGREEGWPLWMLACLAGSVPVLGLLLKVEWQRLGAGRDPLLDLRLFRNPVVTLGLALAFLFYTLSAFFLSYGIWLQGGLQWSPLASGLAILPFGLGFLASPLLMPRLVHRFGGYRVLTLGFALLALGLGTAAALAGIGTPPTGFYAGLAAMGIGQGLVLPSVVRIVLAEVEPDRAGVASGMISATLQIGAAVGAATLGGLFFSALGAHPDAFDYRHAFRVSMFALVAILILCAVLSTALGPLHRRLHSGERTA